MHQGQAAGSDSAIGKDNIPKGTGVLSQIGQQRQEFDQPRILLDQLRMKLTDCPLEYESC